MGGSAASCPQCATLTGGGAGEGASLPCGQRAGIYVAPGGEVQMGDEEGDEVRAALGAGGGQ